MKKVHETYEEWVARDAAAVQAWEDAKNRVGGNPCAAAIKDEQEAFQFAVDRGCFLLRPRRAAGRMVKVELARLSPYGD